MREETAKEILDLSVNVIKAAPIFDKDKLEFYKQEFDLDTIYQILEELKGILEHLETITDIANTQLEKNLEKVKQEFKTTNFELTEKDKKDILKLVKKSFPEDVYNEIKDLL